MNRNEKKYIIEITLKGITIRLSDSLSSEQFTWGKGSETDRFAKLGFRQEEILLNSLK